ncbi:FkbM family methyltransferase [Aeromonas caviae]|uniref:FkbM family methyltransferase n=1 Tax=Aeromonas caviae TaxID=648 RepID=UPI002AB48502|nr:FkbM family methyltransferase [Aeromonas caviae]MDY7843103.1 FkbM family methyltransferase [Aeromonas caviae]
MSDINGRGKTGRHQNQYSQDCFNINQKAYLMNSVITHQVELLYAKSNRLIDLIENKSMFGIFGTGKLAQDCYAKIKEMGHTASFFVDRNEEDGIFMNLPLKTIKYISQKNIPLLVASTWAKEITLDLIATGFKGEVFVIDPFVTVFERMKINDTKELIGFYASLEDDISKKTLCDIISFRCGDVDKISTSSYPQYMSPNVLYSSSDIMIDGGAYIGDTIQSLDCHNVFVREIHAFEPDLENFQALALYGNKTKLKVVSNNLGLWSSEQELKFSANDTVSYGRRVDEEGGVAIHTTSIDGYVNSHGIEPTIIKLDIEGAEMHALVGAKNIIATKKPKLAISLYHSQADLWRIPAFIRSLNPDYLFYLGHHRSNWMETVLYAQSKVS